MMRIKLLIIISVFSVCLLSCKPDNAKLVQEGKILLEKNDCKTCHHPINKGIGPAHTTVAEKYEYTDDNVTLLAKRIINGGSGTWGDVPMNPHPDLSQEDAGKIARYVLSLDGEEPK
jgi:cytochrome c